MAQNVYMASVAFFVPVRKVMAKSELTLASPETIDFASFVLYPNASCKAFRLRKKRKKTPALCLRHCNINPDLMANKR